ncbi:hypothetical protein LCGC14_2679530 [marine sediment metagenome]|uniref:Uncharacterized protein n=1 Tax=marine sediment metagenome TaxID=412755 RepID=A0A0F8ZLR4_9ZZZZ
MKDTDELHDNYLDLVKRSENYADSYKYNPLRKVINRYCLDNPRIVASLIFEDRSDRVDVIRYQKLSWDLNMRYELIFIFSMDDCRTCKMESNRKWGLFMNRFIIPRAKSLEDDIARSIKWHQRVHGL